MSTSKKIQTKKWFNPLAEFDDDGPPKKTKKHNSEAFITKSPIKAPSQQNSNVDKYSNIGSKNWMKNFNPINVEDMAVQTKKVQEVEDWLKIVHTKNCSDMMVLSGLVGCGKTATLLALASKYCIKVTEWITPLDIEMPTEYGDYEFKEKQSNKFLDFILNAANFTSLLDNNSKKLVLVEDFPNTFIRTPSEFTDVLHQYKSRAKSPIVFICSESHTDNRSTAINLFTPNLKEQFRIHHVSFNAVSATSLKTALKRVADIMNKKYASVYNPPTSEMIECVVNSSGGDVRSAVLNLHFASLKGSSQRLETSFIVEKEKGKSKTTKKKKHLSSKFMSIGKDQTVTILHGVGRVLNPKVIVNDKGKQMLTHSPEEIIEQFLSQPNSFVNFLEENYLSHFSCADHADRAATALSDADFMLAEWREKICQEYGLYTSVAGVMLANKAPISTWNPVRGPKTMRVQYPSPSEIPLLEQNYLYKGKILVTDYKPYCKIIGT